MSAPVQYQFVERAISEVFLISPRDLASPHRQAHFVKPRHALFAAAQELAQLSTPRIGEKVGGRDHTTVCHGLVRHRERLATPDYRQQYIRVLARARQYHDDEMRARRQSRIRRENELFKTLSVGATL